MEITLRIQRDSENNKVTFRDGDRVMFDGEMCTVRIVSRDWISIENGTKDEDTYHEMYLPQEKE